MPRLPTRTAFLLWAACFNTTSTDASPPSSPRPRPTWCDFKSTEHAAKLFALQELGNIYTRLGNPTTDVLEKRVCMLEGTHPLAGLCLASGTSAVFYSIINVAKNGDNIVSGRNLYGGTYTQFNDILPKMGITVRGAHSFTRSHGPFTLPSPRVCALRFLPCPQRVALPASMCMLRLATQVRFVDETDPENFVKAMDDKTRAFFCETCSNPACIVTDLEKISTLAHSNGVPLIVDATFSTPYLTKPISYGADVVCHSLTKWMGGHGTGIGGIVVDAGTFKWGAGKVAHAPLSASHWPLVPFHTPLFVHYSPRATRHFPHPSIPLQHPLYSEPDSSYGELRWGLDLPEMLAPLAFILRMRTVPLRNLGAAISPDNSWIFLQGIETLPLRMEKHCANALAVAKFLQSHPQVEWVKYPGLEGDKQYELQKKYLKGKGGAMVIFGVKGGKEAGQKVIESFTVFSHVANVGDAKSLAIHPASTTHSQMNAEQQAAAGVPPEMVRLAVGLEDPADLIADLEHALTPAPPKPAFQNREDMKTYLANSNLESLVTAAVAAVIQERPEHPAARVGEILLAGPN